MSHPVSVKKTTNFQPRTPEDSPRRSVSRPLTGVAFPTDLGWMALQGTTRGLRRLRFGLRGMREARLELPNVVDPLIYTQTSECLDCRTAGELAARGDWWLGAVQLLIRYASGEPVPITRIPVDLVGMTPFMLAVIRACRDIPRGQVETYGDLARAVNHPGAARAVGTVMAKNQIPLVIPCHRVIGHKGLQGYSAPGGLATKMRLLQLEGVTLPLE
ncbi:MAG: methylated-DNA--[protein]-cysteine S-methyltransferase [Pirellulales bacterium]|nr:methylated-DNA--[protein]-cysteine S-methyltransferase [Pirellulales bacterium]